MMSRYMKRTEAPFLHVSSPRKRETTTKACLLSLPPEALHQLHPWCTCKRLAACQELRSTRSHNEITEVPPAEIGKVQIPGHQGVGEIQNTQLRGQSENCQAKHPTSPLSPKRDNNQSLPAKP